MRNAYIVESGKKENSRAAPSADTKRGVERGVEKGEHEAGEVDTRRRKAK